MAVLIRNAVASARTVAVERIAVINLLPVIFEVGDQVVHPQYGVGKVVSLKDESFVSGIRQQYYEVFIVDGSTVWVPVDLATSGLRNLADKDDIKRCRKILALRPDPLIEDARMRQTMLGVRLRQGTIFEQCKVVRDLYAHGEHKSLIGPMANFFRSALNVLVQEWSVIENVTTRESMQEINSLLEISRNNLNKKST